MSVAFFDLDRTLVDVNSGKLWIRSELKAGRLTYRDALKGVWWLFRYSIGHHDLDHAYKSAVRKLEGASEDVVRQRTLDWFARDVAHRVRPGALAALAAHRTAGDRLVVATSSSPYAAEAARLAFDLDECLSTVFEVHAGHFTGHIKSSAYGPAKGDRLIDWAQAHEVDLAQCTLYTDSVSDLTALEAVGNPVAVNPDRKLAVIARDRGWQLVDWGESG